MRRVGTRPDRGFTAASFHNDLHWRWAETPEERLIAKSGNEPGALPPARTAAGTPEKRPVAQSGNDPAAPAGFVQKRDS